MVVVKQRPLVNCYWENTVMQFVPNRGERLLQFRPSEDMKLKREVHSAQEMKIYLGADDGAEGPESPGLQEKI